MLRPTRQQEQDDPVNAAERPKVACRGSDLRESGRRHQSSPQVAWLLALAARVARAIRGPSGWLQAAYPGPGQRG